MFVFTIGLCQIYFNLIILLCSDIQVGIRGRGTHRQTDMEPGSRTIPFTSYTGQIWSHCGKIQRLVLKYGLIDLKFNFIVGWIMDERGILPVIHRSWGGYWHLWISREQSSRLIHKCQYPLRLRWITILFTYNTRLLGRRSHSLSQHTQVLKNNMIAENDFLLNFDTIKRLVPIITPNKGISIV